MGIVTKCCTSQLYNSDTYSPSQTNENQNEYNNSILIKKIPEIKDSNQGLNYICSKECSNITSKLSRTIFIKKLCNEMNTSEIYLFLKKLINWILSFKTFEEDEEIKEYISKIQIYTKLGTKKILSELNSISTNFTKEEEEMLLQSLSDWVMLAQLIISLNNEEFLKKKNIENNIKKYVFEGSYFLIKIKMKLTYKQSDKISLDKIVPIQTNIKINSDTKNEIKKLVSLVEDFTLDLIDINEYK